MKKITEQDLKEYYPTRPGGYTRKSKFLRLLAALDVGEILAVSKEEWATSGYKAKNPSLILSSALSQFRKGHRSVVAGMEFERYNNDTGWAFKKIK